MWPFLAVLGGVLANELQAAEREKEQKKQLIANMRMQYAKSLDPDVPTYGFQAAQAKSQMDAERDAGRAGMVGSLLPMALQGLGQMSSATSGNEMLNKQTERMSGALGNLNDRFNVQSGEINPFRGSSQFEPTIDDIFDRERPMY